MQRTKVASLRSPFSFPYQCSLTCIFSLFSFENDPIQTTLFFVLISQLREKTYLQSIEIIHRDLSFLEKYIEKRGNRLNEGKKYFDEQENDC